MKGVYCLMMIISDGDYNDGYDDDIYDLLADASNLVTRLTPAIRVVNAQRRVRPPLTEPPNLER